jgi:hypothetical protein
MLPREFPQRRGSRRYLYIGRQVSKTHAFDGISLACQKLISAIGLTLDDRTPQETPHQPNVCRMTTTSCRSNLVCVYLSPEKTRSPHINWICKNPRAQLSVECKPSFKAIGARLLQGKLKFGLAL